MQQAIIREVIIPPGFGCPSLGGTGSGFESLISEGEYSSKSFHNYSSPQIAT